MYQIDVWICNFMVTYVWVSQPSHLPGITEFHCFKCPHVSLPMCHSPCVPMSPLVSNQNMSGWPSRVTSLAWPSSTDSSVPMCPHELTVNLIYCCRGRYSNTSIILLLVDFENNYENETFYFPSFRTQSFIRELILLPGLTGYLTS